MIYQRGVLTRTALWRSPKMNPKEEQNKELNKSCGIKYPYTDVRKLCNKIYPKVKSAKEKKDKLVKKKLLEQIHKRMQ